jgi:nucleoside-diphosphate-sugar epimerase
MQTILGAGGVIGTGVARELAGSGRAIRLVGRQPRAVNARDELVSADLTQPEQVERAVSGSRVAYLVAGLPFTTRVWQVQWPRVMANVVEACVRHGTRLVFFDNVYLYGKVDGVMTESTPVNPASRKGEVRARIAEMLMKEVKRGSLTALIARSADFYGPGATNTFVHPMVFEKLRRGQKAAWLADDGVAHSMTYTPDAAKAVALLGNTPEAFGEVWHLPTCGEPPTGAEFIKWVAEAFGVAPEYQVLKPWMLRVVGLFNPTVRETLEMLYQNQLPYVFDSSKFNARFFPPTSYREGIMAVVRSPIGRERG